MWLETLAWVTFIAACDRFFVRLDLSSRHDLSLRFFLVHSVVNALIIWFSLHDMASVIQDPGSSILAPFDLRPLQLVVALHVYHFKDYTSLTAVDWVHHLSVLYLAGITVYFKKDGPGPLCNFCLFFICGLPGLIDYLLLVGRRWRRVSALAEKKWNTILHLWVRCPGLMLYGGIAYTANATTGWRIRLAQLSFFVLPVLLNGIYFAHRVCFNYGYTVGLARRPPPTAGGHGPAAARS